MTTKKQIPPRRGGKRNRAPELTRGYVGDERTEVTTKKETFMHEGHTLASQLQALRPGHYKAAVVLGSGLGPFADTVENAVRVPFADLPGFPVSGVSGHSGAVILGTIAGKDVMVLSGRAHFYEHGNAAVMRPAIAAIAAMGIETLFLTNAAGSLRKNVGPGEIMMLTDHINFAGTNPLFGEPTDRRFVDLSQAYDKGLQAAFREAASLEGVRLHEGVYMWFNGPSFETPAEIHAARVLGADAVGMSTVPEVILARFFGLKVAAISALTNLAAGMSPTPLSHHETKEMAPLGAAKIIKLLPRVIAGL